MLGPLWGFWVEVNLSLYGGSYYAAIFGPGAVIVPNLGILKKLSKHKPCMGGGLAYSAVGDDLFIGGNTLLSIDFAKLF